MNFIGFVLLFILLFPMIIQFHPNVSVGFLIFLTLFLYFIFGGENKTFINKKTRKE